MKKRYFRLFLPSCIVIAVLMSGCSKTQPQEVNAMSTTSLEANKTLVRTFVDAVNQRNYEALDEILAENFQRHSTASPAANAVNREEMIAFLRADETTFPDLHNTIGMMAAEGNLVAVHASLRGTMGGPMGDIPPTGNSVEVPFISFFRIEEGRIAEMWVEWDNVNLLSQLGLFPPPGSAAARQ